MEASQTPQKEAPVADAGVTPPAKPAVKKEEAPSPPLVDNGDGTATDPKTGLMWKKTDAWLDSKKFYKWPDHKAYVDDVNKKQFAGHSDWRIPTKAEAASLIDKVKQCVDKNGTMIPLDPVFDAGCASNTWISECAADKIVRFDFKVGVDTPYPGTDIWASMRLVRKAA
jgi:hypothetical protein